jgi:molecular chaperone IbpA
MTRNAFFQGFPELDDLFDSAFRCTTESSFPRYDVIRDGDTFYIDIAVAGFRQDQIELSVENDTLVIKGMKDPENDDEQRVYLYRGLAHRAFTQKFSLGEYLKVEAAILENGILRVTVVKEIPEHKRPKLIPIMSL